MATADSLRWRFCFKSQRPLFITSLTFPVCCLFDKTQRALLEFGIPSLQGPGLQKREKMVMLWVLVRLLVFLSFYMGSGTRLPVPSKQYKLDLYRCRGT